jgi:hypothetical protein
MYCTGRIECIAVRTIMSGATETPEGVLDFLYRKLLRIWSEHGSRAVL